MASKSSAPSRSMTISPSSAERGGRRSPSGSQLGEVAKQRALVPAPEAQLAVEVLEHAAKPVPLGLVLPALTGRELADELGLHRREGQICGRHRAIVRAARRSDGDSHGGCKAGGRTIAYMAVTADPRIGSVLAGYRIEALLGRGGMGVVYLAEQVRLKRKVALKLLAPELAGDERFRERLLRESRAGRLDRSSERDPRLRRGRGRRCALSSPCATSMAPTSAAARRGGPPGAGADDRPALAGGRGARRRPRARPRPSRRQAGQRAHRHPGRPRARLPGRLRPQRRLTVAGSRRAQPLLGLGRLRRARAGPPRAPRRARRPLRARLRPPRMPHRPAAVPARIADRHPLRPPQRRPAVRRRCQPRPARGDRRRAREGARQGARGAPADLPRAHRRRARRARHRRRTPELAPPPAPNQDRGRARRARDRRRGRSARPSPHRRRIRATPTTPSYEPTIAVAVDSLQRIDPEHERAGGHLPGRRRSGRDCRRRRFGLDGEQDRQHGDSG